MKLPDQHETVYVRNREEWRKWLEKNNGTAREIWQICYKKHTGKPSVGYNDAVEEALCFGWIDSLIKKVDNEIYLRKFTPRNQRSSWSRANVERIKKMISEGRMTEKGLELYHYAREKGLLPGKSRIRKKVLFIPDYVHEALDKNPIARDHFQRLSPSNKRYYILWITDGKKEETRLRRLSEAIRLLEQGRPLGMK